MGKKFIFAIMLAASLTAIADDHSGKLTTGTQLALSTQTNAKLRKISGTSLSGQNISVFIKYDGAETVEQIKSLGAQIGTVAKTILTASVPVSAVNDIAALDGVKVIEAAQPATYQMDVSRQATQFDKVLAQTSPLNTVFLGKGVVVGDIDGGLDFGHPDFYTSDRKELRIRRAWMQSATTGGHAAPKGYGREFSTPEELVTQGTDLSSLAHSTHVLGIAAGADTLTPYYGIARKADIVFSDFRNTDTGIMDAMSYIFNYADSVGEPAVINMSLGTMMGPHDGTSLRDQMADELSGPGHIFVGAVGNNGTVTAHASKTFEGGDTLLLGVGFLETLGMPGTGELELWGDSAGSFRVRVVTVVDSTLQFAYQSRAFNAANSTNRTVTLQKPYDGSSGSFQIVTQTSPLNGRPTAHIELNISDYKPDKHIGILVTADKGQTVHAWTNPTYCAFRPFLPNMARPDSLYQVCEIGGTGKRVISVGAYTTKPLIVDLNGDTINIGGKYYPNGLPKDEVAAFSNQGPTLDGRMKPDISAPGTVIVSALSRYMINQSGYMWKSTDTFNGRQYGYGGMSGTSMAAPHVAGIIATWLEADPTLTPEQAKEAIRNTAIHDTFTGDNPNNSYGYGKINAYDGLVYVLQNFVGKDPTAIDRLVSREGGSFKATPQADGLHILYLSPVSNTSVNVYTTGGTLVKSVNLESAQTGDDRVISLDGKPSGLYIINVKTGNESHSYKYIHS